MERESPGTSRAVQASFNAFPMIWTMLGEARNLDGISINIQEETLPLTSGCKMNENRL